MVRRDHFELFVEMLRRSNLASDSLKNCRRIVGQKTFPTPALLYAGGRTQRDIGCEDDLEWHPTYQPQAIAIRRMASKQAPI
jgi:hypothetical protein